MAHLILLYSKSLHEIDISSHEFSHLLIHLENLLILDDQLIFDSLSFFLTLLQ